LKQALASIDRRTLLIGGGIGVGLIVGFVAWPRGLDSALVGLGLRGSVERGAAHLPVQVDVVVRLGYGRLVDLAARYHLL